MPDSRDVHLFVPGPVGSTEGVIDAFVRPTVPHYGADFVARYNRCCRQLQKIFLTNNDLFLIVGPGTAALDAAMGSSLPSGSRVLSLVNGLFASRLAEMARAHGSQVEVMEWDLGEPIDVDRVLRRIATEPHLNAVSWVQHETSTAVLNPVEPIARACREHGVLSIIDAISSLGGAELRVDDWGVDLCVSVSNKCIAAPPGLAPITVSPHAWDAIGANPNTRSWYGDLRTWRRYRREWRGWHPYPTTVPTHVLFALKVAAEELLAEGLDARLEKTSTAAHRVRAAIRELGFQMFVDDAHASPITTAVRTRPDIDTETLLRLLRERHGIYLSGGLADLHGVIFRIGHMGTASDPDEVDFLLEAIEEALPAAAVPN